MNISLPTPCDPGEARHEKNNDHSELLSADALTVADA
jgi:hypothetical protein